MVSFEKKCKTLVLCGSIMKNDTGKSIFASCRQEHVTTKRASLGCQNFILDFIVNENCLLTGILPFCNLIISEIPIWCFYQFDHSNDIVVLLSQMCVVMHFYLLYAYFPYSLFVGNNNKLNGKTTKHALLFRMKVPLTLKIFRCVCSIFSGHFISRMFFFLHYILE